MPEISERRRNLAPWAGLLLGLVAILSNAAFFMAIPGQRAIPFLSWTLAVIALVFALTGVMRSFRQPQVYGGKVSSSVLAVITVLIVGLTMFASVHSRDLPGSAGAPQPGQKAPDFTLADTSGNKVSLDQLLGSAGASTAGSTNANIASGGAGSAVAPKAVLLIFYRGYW
jgi:hypothetical protein